MRYNLSCGLSAQDVSAWLSSHGWPTIWLSWDVACYNYRLSAQDMTEHNFPFNHLLSIELYQGIISSCKGAFCTDCDTAQSSFTTDVPPKCDALRKASSQLSVHASTHQYLMMTVHLPLNVCSSSSCVLGLLLQCGVIGTAPLSWVVIWWDCAICSKLCHVYKRVCEKAANIHF